MNFLEASRSSSKLNTKKDDNKNSEEEIEWIENIKDAFFEASDGQKQISFGMWKVSNLDKLLIPGTTIDQQKFVEIFKQIDINSQGFITWSDLIEHMMCMQKSVTERTIDKQLVLTYVEPEASIERRYKNKQKIIRIFCIPFNDCIATVTEKSIQMWDEKSCKPLEIINEQDTIIDCALIEILRLLAIIKTNRRVEFYDLREKKKLNFVLRANIQASMISELSAYDCKRTLKNYNIKNPPLFHSPTTIVAIPNTTYFIIGNEEGYIEVYKMFREATETGTWDAKRIMNYQLHTKTITQISWIDELQCFISSSADGTIIFWVYSIEHNLIYKKYTNKDPKNQPIVNFVFDKRTSNLFYVNPTRYIGVVKAFHPGVRAIETPVHRVASMEVLQVSKESSFLITLSYNNFLSIYVATTLELANSYYLEMHHQTCAPTKMLFYNNFIYMCGSYLSKWNGESCDSGVFMPHKSTIIGIIANSPMENILSCDSKGNIHAWDMKSALKLFTFHMNDEIDDVTTFVPCNNVRKLAIGYNSGKIKIISTNSGNLLAKITPKDFTGGISFLAYGIMNGIRYLVAGTYKNEIVLFEDLLGSDDKFRMRITGHKEQINGLCIIKNSFILTIGTDREMFIWTPKSIVPHVEFKVDSPTCCCDIDDNEKHFLVADIYGNVNIYDILSADPVLTFQPFRMYKQYPITAMEYSEGKVFVGNSGGYIAMVTLNDNKIEQVFQVRANINSVLYIKHSSIQNVLITSGDEQDIKVFSDNGRFIGQIGKNKGWNVTDPETWVFDSMLENDPSDFEEQSEDSDSEVEMKLDSKTFPSFSREFSDISKGGISNESFFDEEEEYRPITKPEFTMDNCISMLDFVERAYAESFEKTEKEKPIIKETPVKKKNKIKLDDFIPNDSLEKNYNHMEALIGKKQVIPTFLKKKKKH